MTKKAAAETDPPFIDCTIKMLPKEQHVEAARRAVEENPANAPSVTNLPRPLAALLDDPARAALLVGKWWGAKGVDLTVGFMETTNGVLRDRILSHANSWGEFANVRFRWTQNDPQVRVSRGRGGYFSYLGTDILQIPKGEQTLNLEGFVMSTPEGEFTRVVRHEFGHTLGFPHEHARQEIIDLLDAEKTIAYFMATQGWSREEVIQQVLRPLDPESIRATASADSTSLMCYSFPPSVTKSGRGIPGGKDIDALDRSFAASCYPKAVAPPPPSEGSEIVIRITNAERIVVDDHDVIKRERKRNP